MKNGIFFYIDELDKMAEFTSSLKFHGQRFKSEKDKDGYWIIIY